MLRDLAAWRLTLSLWESMCSAQAAALASWASLESYYDSRARAVLCHRPLDERICDINPHMISINVIEAANV